MTSVNNRISYPVLLLLMIFLAIERILEQVKEPCINPIKARYASPWIIYFLINIHKLCRQDAYVPIQK